MIGRRKILTCCTRTRLLELARRFEITGMSAWSKGDIVDVLVSERRQIPTDELLQKLSREELKAICVEASLDGSGRHRQALIDRILGTKKNNRRQKKSRRKPAMRDLEKARRKAKPDWRNDPNARPDTIGRLERVLELLPVYGFIEAACRRARCSKETFYDFKARYRDFAAEAPDTRIRSGEAGANLRQPNERWPAPE